MYDDALEKRIKLVEGFNLHPYPDSRECPTIYWGHLIKVGETFNNTEEEAEAILKADLDEAWKGAIDLFPEIGLFSQGRQDALTELVYNMGYNKLAKQFPRFIHNVNIGNFEQAARELEFADGKSIPSQWILQVHSARADVILNELELG
jgi:lysozyme